MSNSALAKSYIPAHSNNHWGTRKEKIKKIIIHHAAGTLTAESLAKMFANASRGASATYCIGYDGTIIRGLDENITPGTSEGYEADKDAVTIEVSNSATRGDWPVSDAALNSIIKLCADIAKRNNLGNLVKGKNLCWHAMFAPTACPGPYLLSKMDYIATKANEINNTKKVVKDVVVNGFNIHRAADYLVIYTGDRGDSTGTNKWGAEAAFDSNCVALGNPVYGVGNMQIPAGGFVLSGHGTASTWVLNNVKKGKKLNLATSVK